MPHRLLLRRVGLRGEAMVLLGVVWCLIGVGVLRGTSDPPTGAGLWHLLIPPVWRGSVWIATGLLAVLGARWRLLSDWALALLALMPIVQFSSYMWAWGIALIPGPPPGLAGGWYPSLFQATLVGFVIFVAHIPHNRHVEIDEAALLQRLQTKGPKA